jgi:hypothetical protein
MLRMALRLVQLLLNFLKPREISYKFGELFLNFAYSAEVYIHTEVCLKGKIISDFPSGIMGTYKPFRPTKIEALQFLSSDKICVVQPNFDVSCT